MFRYGVETKYLVRIISLLSFMQSFYWNLISFLGTQTSKLLLTSCQLNTTATVRRVILLTTPPVQVELNKF